MNRALSIILLALGCTGCDQIPLPNFLSNLVSAEQPAPPVVEMVEVPAGSFEMGCKAGRDTECADDLSTPPPHTVTLRAFEIGKYEVTQAQWVSVMGSNPSSASGIACGSNCPVEMVSWDDIQIFLRKLNERADEIYRLPSEAEWEYACRAGENHDYCGSNNLGGVAWYNANSKTALDIKQGNNWGSIQPVGRKQPNAWGLHDMSGNVSEWVQDVDHDKDQKTPIDGSAFDDGVGQRIRRGGGVGEPFEMQAADRAASHPLDRHDKQGFRLARTLP